MAQKEYRYISTLPFVCLTSTLDWGTWLTPGTGRFYAWIDARYPLHKRLVWDPGTIWKGAENFTLTGVRLPDRPGKSEALDHLRYVGPV
jgi:hypothetical protein